mgnify:CR=1 FL=1
MHYLLTYHYSADYLQRRGAFCNGHLAGAWASQGRGLTLTHISAPTGRYATSYAVFCL